MSSATTHLTTTILRADGFTCPSCVAKIEKHVGRLSGVDAVTVRYASARIEIVHDADEVGVDELVAAVAQAGYTARPTVF